MGLPALVCAPLGVFCARSVPPHVLQVGFNAMTTVLVPVQIWAVAQKMLNRRSDSGRTAGEDDMATTGRHDHSWRLLGMVSVFGAAMGWTNGFMGVAGLPFVVTFLTLATDLPHHVIIGTTFASVTPTVLAAVTAHIRAQTVPLRLMPSLLGGAGIGCVAGATMSLNTSPEILQMLFILSLVAAGTRSSLTLKRLLALTPKLHK